MADPVVTKFERASEIAFPIRGTSESREVTYLATLSEPVVGEHDPIGDRVVIIAARAAVPDDWDGIPIEDLELLQLTPTVFRVTVKYASSKNDSSLSSGDGTPATGRWSFKLGSENSRIYVAYSQLAFSPAGGPTAPSHGNYLVVSRSEAGLKVEGSDVPTAVQEWTYRAKVHRSFLDTPLPLPYPPGTYYTTLVESLGPCVNNAVYRRRQPGEVLFLGLEGEVPDSGYAELSWHFAIKATPVFPGDTLGGCSIPSNHGIYGWDIVWADWKEVVPGANDIAVGARGIYAGRVLLAKDLALLGLGG